MSSKMLLNKKKQGAFVQEGYRPHLRQIIENLKLPEEISCAICHLPHPQEHYSKGQLLSLRHALYSQGPSILIDQRVAKCPNCCCSATVERRCRFCNHWKGIDDFAHTQRTLEQPVCKKCQDYYQVSAYALGIPIIAGLIEAGDEPKPQYLLPWNEEDAKDDTKSSEHNSDPDEDEEDIPPIVTLIGAGETESPMSRRLRSATTPAKASGFVKVRPPRPPESEQYITPPESPPPENSGDERDTDMETWEYL